METWFGYLAAFVAVIFFGSNFVPVKKFETGDGMFFQWILCAAIWIVGLIVNFVQEYPPFQPIAMIGGILWCTGNLLTVPIIKMIGLGLGILLWGITNLIMGWATSTFGLFSTDKLEMATPWANYLGISLVVFSVAFYALVKPTVKSSSNTHETLGDDEALSVNDTNKLLLNKGYGSQPIVVQEEDSFAFIERLPPTVKRPLGIALAVVAGLFYGVNFTPALSLNHNNPHPIPNLDFVFSHFCGIFLASTFYFMVYCAIKRNRPVLYPQTILPGLISGAMWAIAQTSFFIANEKPGPAVAFAIITTGPGAIGCLWAILAFGEIRGIRNYLFFAFAVLFNAIGVAFIVVARSVKL